MIQRRVPAAALGALWASLALIAPGQAAGQDRAFEDRLDARTLELVAPILADAERDSLPAATLRAKILEGAAKSRPPELIARVVGQMAADLRSTRTELRGLVPRGRISGEELVAAVLARQQGVGVELLAELWQVGAPEGALQIPVTVLGELVRRGVPAAEASALMRHVVSSGVPLDRTAQIPGRFDGASRAGAAAAEALQRALRDLDIAGPPAGRGPGGPSDPSGAPGPGNPGGPDRPGGPPGPGGGGE